MFQKELADRILSEESSKIMVDYQYYQIGSLI